jgi:hypothetical protein
MSGPLSEFWVVEYHFFGDCFSVTALPEYLGAMQKAFHEGDFRDRVLLSIHPNPEGAEEACSGWQDWRNQSPLTPKQRYEKLKPHVEGLKSMI